MRYDYGTSLCDSGYKRKPIRRLCFQIHTHFELDRMLGIQTLLASTASAMPSLP